MQPNTTLPGAKQLGGQASVEIKPGVRLRFQPRNADEARSIRFDLLILVKEKKITPDEARAYLRAQKRRLGLDNPNNTPAFDKMLRDHGLM